MSPNARTATDKQNLECARAPAEYGPRWALEPMLAQGWEAVASGRWPVASTERLRGWLKLCAGALRLHLSDSLRRHNCGRGAGWAFRGADAGAVPAACARV